MDNETDFEMNFTPFFIASLYFSVDGKYENTDRQDIETVEEKIVFIKDQIEVLKKTLKRK